jgi:hypothetical protein
MDAIEYRKINDSFERTFVFHLGVDSGFFSEFNNMVLAILYCLTNKIRFVLYSGDANFKINRGWDDFFMPFCDETRAVVHRKLNRRYPSRHVSLTRRLAVTAFKRIHGIDYLTHDLWNSFRSPDFAAQSFSFSNHRDLDLRGAAQILISMLWKYNPETRCAIETLKNSVPLPEEYLGLHVRSGDKHVEALPLNIPSYMRKAMSISSLRNIFLLTDNWIIYEEAKRNYPGYTFSTLCLPSDRGYVHREFVKSGKDEREVKLLRLFASIDILASARYFVGTFSANPGMYLGMRMDRTRAFSADGHDWRIR